MTFRQLSRPYGAVGIGLFVVFIGVGSFFIFDSGRAAQAKRKIFIYSVAFACVNEVGHSGQAPDVPFEPAVYRTAVNVHNFEDEPVVFTKKAVLTRSQDSPRGPITTRVTETLGPNNGVAIDCLDLQELFGGQQAALPGNGLVILESPTELDVVAIYTGLVIVAGGGRGAAPTGAGLAMDVEYIQPKVVQR